MRKMNSGRFAVLGLALVSMALAGCGRKSDFLYDKGIERIVGIKSESISHKVVEMVGTDQLDILWVIDNSGSMYSSQQSVIQNTGLFINEFSKNQAKLNWRMGLLSTDIADGPYLGMQTGTFLDSLSADPVGGFQSAVGRLGIDGSTTEQTFEPVLRSLKANPDFLRPGAYLGLIIVTDEEEQSSMDTAAFLSELSQLKPLDKVLTFGIFNDTSMGGTCDGGAYRNSRYQDLITQTNGKIYPLCSPDFGNTLASIGNGLAKLSQSPTIKLSQRPVLGTLKVLYRGQELPGGPASAGGYWRYDYGQNAIVFHDTSFVVNYQGEIQLQFETEVVLQEGT